VTSGRVGWALPSDHARPRAELHRRAMRARLNARWRSRLYAGEQVAGWNIECLAEPDDRKQAGVTTSALDTIDLGRVVRALRDGAGRGPASTGSRRAVPRRAG
jgi:hypothetical protein